MKEKQISLQANLMMPEFMTRFKKLPSHFYNEDNADLKHVTIKLTNYFEVPFVAVLLRLYELRILVDLADVKELLELDSNKIEALFKEMWLDTEILKPSLKDEMDNWFKVINDESERLIKNNMITRNNAEQIIQNINKFYRSIRVE